MRYQSKPRLTGKRVLGLLLILSVVGLLLPTRLTGRLMNLVQVLVPLQDAATRAAKPFFMRACTGLLRPQATILGSEFAGEIEALGSGVTSFEVGDRVFGYNEGPFGAHAEYMTVPENGSIATMPVVLNAHAAGNIYLDVVGVNTTFTEPNPADIVDGLELNLLADTGDIYLNTGKGILIDEQFVETIEIAGNMIDIYEPVSREAHAIYDLNSIKADQGDIHINITGDANIGKINSTTAMVLINTTGSLYDLDESSPDTNIAAVNISLSVPDGSIGKENALLSIDSSTAAAGLLLAAAKNNIFIK